MDIKILETDEIIAKICLDWYWNKFIFGIESYCYCGDGEFFIHLGFLKIVFIVFSKKRNTEDPFDQLL